MAPVRNAVSLVNSDQGQRPLCEHLGKAGDREPLRRHEEKIERAVEIVLTDSPRGKTVTTRVDSLGGDAELLERRHLVFHQRDER